MKPVVRIEPLPSPERAEARAAALEARDQAADHASRTARTMGARNEYALRKAVHQESEDTYRVVGQTGDAGDRRRRCRPHHPEPGFEDREPGKRGLGTKATDRVHPDRSPVENTTNAEPRRREARHRRRKEGSPGQRGAHPRTRGFTHG